MHDCTHACTIAPTPLHHTPGPIECDVRWPIHRDPPTFADQSTEAEVLVTGIKVV